MIGHWIAWTFFMGFCSDVHCSRTSQLMCCLQMRWLLYTRVYLMWTFSMSGQPKIHTQRNYMYISNDSLWMCCLVLSMIFWFDHTYYRSNSMANIILFFWNRFYQNCYMMFESPFVTGCCYHTNLFGTPWGASPLQHWCAQLLEYHFWGTMNWAWWTSPLATLISWFI